MFNFVMNDAILSVKFDPKIGLRFNSRFWSVSFTETYKQDLTAMERRTINI